MGFLRVGFSFLCESLPKDEIVPSSYINPKIPPNLNTLFIQIEHYGDQPEIRELGIPRTKQKRKHEFKIDRMLIRMLQMNECDDLKKLSVETRNYDYPLGVYEPLRDLDPELLEPLDARGIEVLKR